jgi:hypothetical protein
MSRSTFPRHAARALSLLAALAWGDHLANAQSVSGPLGMTVLGAESSYLDLGAGVFDVPIHRGAPARAASSSVMAKSCSTSGQRSACS